MMMKAAIYYGPGDIRIEEIEHPKAENGIEGLGMVLKTGACGICDVMDIPTYQGTSQRTKPGIAMGHEYSGEVIEVGPNVTTVKVGDRVRGLSLRPCLECEACRVKNYAGCNKYGQSGAGHGTNGAFAEYVLFPFATNNIVKLTENMSFQDGAIIEPTRLCIGLAEKAEPDDAVVIFGQKFMGIATLLHLKAMGITKVIVSDVSKKRLAKAKELGADIVIDELNDDVVKTIMKETSGKGAQVVIETSGRPDNFTRAIELVAEGNVKSSPPRKGGKIWLSQPFEAPFEYNGRLKGGSSIHQPWGTIDRERVYQLTVESIDSGEITAEKVVTHVFPLDKTREAFETVIHSDEAIKVMVEP